MRAIPNHSTYSPMQGMWFVFSLDEHKFSLWVSTFTGKEEAYVDSTLVATRRKIALSSEHSITVDGTQYTIALVSRNVQKGVIECVLSREGKAALGLVTEYTRRRSGVARVTTMVATAVIILVGVKLQFPPWSLWVGLAAIFGTSIVWATRRNGFVIRELPVIASA